MAEMTASFSVVAEEPLAPVEKVERCEYPTLIVRKGPQPGERFIIDRPRLTIGRDPKCDVFLNDMTVSRTHAVVEQRDGSVTISDSGSLNGTSVNGDVVDHAILHDGDVLQIGTFQMVYRAPCEERR
ncbi:MAG: FHA domain-containing protein [Coriobacteriia bacterium]